MNYRDTLVIRTFNHEEKYAAILGIERIVFTEFVTGSISRFLRLSFVRAS